MIDIIIPVYDAYEDLKKCVESVMRHTNLEQNRLIFVNDHSPDKRIAPYLDELAADNILVHHNEKNMGFSANVNYGIQCSETHDVLLLNTDTVVTKGWLEKIASCAARDERIGSVTPLSNRAEICSVPGYLEKNDIPTGYTIDSFAELVERCSLHLYPQISVAIGFCMFIKREVIRKVGLFDADTFQRGYGEENDFCNRAAILGYYHVMCDDTFIYHTGCASFREARNELCIQHEQILRNRYPDLMHQNDVYIRDNPNKQVSENIKLHLALEQDRKTVMLVSHRDFRKGAIDNIGGVQLHVADLVKNLRKQCNVIVVARDGDRLAVTAYSTHYEYTLWFYIGEQPHTPMVFSQPMHRLFVKIMRSFSVDVVHIQHIHGLSFEPFRAAKELRIPVICTLHDFYFLCPTVKCVRPDGCFCDISEDCDQCFECMSENTDIGFDSTVFQEYINNWRSVCEEMLTLCSEIIVPSENVGGYYSKVYPRLKTKIHVIPHGIDFCIASVQRPRNKLHVAFFGGLSFEKGSQVAMEMINEKTNTKWYAVGMIGDHKLQEIENKNLIKVGPYTRDKLPELMRRYSIGLACIPSIWPETFCYTVSEAVACGIPVLCFDLGAQGERVRSGGFGWTVPLEGGAKAMLRKIQQIQNDPAEYERAVQACHQAQGYHTAEMTSKYVELYNQMPLCAGGHQQDLSELLSEQGNSASGIGASSARVAELTAKLYEIETAPSYQMMLRFRKNLPFKKQLKKMMKISK